MSDNVARVHQTLCVTPEMEAGVADHSWSIAEIGRAAERSVELLDEE